MPIKIETLKAGDMLYDLRRQTADASTLVPLPEGWRWGCMSEGGRIYAYPVGGHPIVYVGESGVEVSRESARANVPPEVVDALKTAHDLGPWQRVILIVPQRKDSP